MLKFYQGASLVVTGRLHAALPCLAMGTPVLMVNSEYKLSHYKFSTYTPYVAHTTPEDLLAGKCSFDFDDPLPNPGGHEKVVKEIRAVCKKFITACEKSDEPKVDLESWRDYNERALRLKKIMQTLLPKSFLPIFDLLENDL